MEKSLADMVRIAELRGIAQVALPRIGAGLGGLDWGDVRSVLQALGDKTAVRLRVCEVFVAGRPLAPSLD